MNTLPGPSSLMRRGVKDAAFRTTLFFLRLTGRRDRRDEVCRLWLLECMKFGVESDGIHPLRDPVVFAAFTEAVRTRGSAFTTLPNKLQEWIRSGQDRLGSDRTRRQGRRLLVISDNWHFFPIAADALEAAGFEIRYLDLETIREVFPRPSKQLRFGRQVRRILSRPKRDHVHAVLAERNPVASDLIGWADVVFCEWFNDAAVWASRYIPESTTLVARVHSYEAFTVYPFLANLQRFDGLIFIAPQIRNVFDALVGRELAPRCPVEVIPNFRDLSAFTPAVRDQAARRTLGMTQYASANKDPMFALDLLDELLAEDPNWRLRLVGAPWREDIDGKEALYRDAFLQRASAFGGNVIFDGYTSEINKWYGEVGYILSTSWREGSHESFIEGMLTGAVPILRDWPMMAPFGAPASVFPGLPRSATPREAADVVRGAAARFDEASETARAYAERLVAQRDPAIELPRFLQEVVNSGWADPAKGKT